MHSAKVWCVAVSPDGELVAAGDYANTVRVYEAEFGEVIWEKTSWIGKGARARADLTPAACEI